MTNLMRLDRMALVECERVIEHGLATFVEVGEALLRIRDDRLYRAEYRTFEDYCQRRWKWGRNYANKQIAAAEVVRNLGTNVPIPENESQARELAPLPPERQREVWTQAQANGQFTALDLKKLVEDVRSEMRTAGELPSAPTPTPRRLTAEERERERAAEEERQRGTEWAIHMGNIEVAVETLADPPLDIARVAAHMKKFDVRDVKWAAQTQRALETLRRLQEALR